ncbi:MAG: HD domain-containing protein, partial [Lentihominibacter sp.]
KDMIIAVAFHTTGRKGMSVLEKIIFLADAIEPGRNYPGVEEMRKTAYTDLDKACIMSLERTVQYVRDRGEYLDPDTEDALNDLKEKQNL